MSGWNGIEVYINIRSKDLYNELERNLQAKSRKRWRSRARTRRPSDRTRKRCSRSTLTRPSRWSRRRPRSTRSTLDVARLRIVRAHLREVNPAVKTGNFAKARDSFNAFDDKWDSIEDLVKARSRDAYDAIEKGMIDIERASCPPSLTPIRRRRSSVA